ncbi:MAG TPA: ATP-binding protein [Candidatus Limnocylindria bacterium]|nr:ATP-binding protein [Candidatus Limnocylindria bacterium]
MPPRAVPDPIAHSLTTRFRETIFSPFVGAVQKYGLIRPGDRIAVCLSGGKDSMLLAKCMQMLQAWARIPFEVIYLSMDPGYAPQDAAMLLKNAALLGIEPEVFRTDIFAAVEQVRLSPCHVCAAMRRGHLYKEAQVRGCNKIALGHHRDDAAETVLLSILYGGQFQAMLPQAKSENYEGMRLIRPLYFVREKAVRAWAGASGLSPITCACRVTRKPEGGKRARVKRLIAELEKEQPNTVDNIVAASSRVDLRGVLSYVPPDGPEKSIMDDFACANPASAGMLSTRIL